MSYSIAQMHLDTAISLYERHEYRKALDILNKVREEFGDNPGKVSTVKKYIRLCLVNMPRK